MTITRSCFALLLLALAAFPDQQTPGSNPQSRPPKPKRAVETVLTGCLDQRGETYVLSSTSNMSKTTTLKGKTFSDDNFARYVGKKVSVRGTMRSEALEVSAVEKLADTCSR